MKRPGVQCSPKKLRKLSWDGMRISLSRIALFYTLHRYRPRLVRSIDLSLNGPDLFRRIRAAYLHLPYRTGDARLATNTGNSMSATYRDRRPLLSRRHFAVPQGRIDCFFRALNSCVSQTLGAIHRLHQILPIIAGRRFSNGHRTKLKVLQRFNRHRNASCKIKINRCPFCDVNLTSCERIQPLNESNILFLGRRAFANRRMHLPRCIALGGKGEFLPEGIHADHSFGDIGLIGQGKQSVHFSTNKSSLNRRSKDRGENSGDGADRSPSIPVHQARATKPPTLTHTIKHRHSASPVPVKADCAMNRISHNNRACAAQPGLVATSTHAVAASMRCQE